MINLFKNAFSLLCVSWDIVYEVGAYYIYGDVNHFVERLAHKLCRQNILYIKIFQACALNNNIFADEINNKLLKFTDNAPWTAVDIDMETLNAFEVSQDMQITHKEAPLKAGMISLIFPCISNKTQEEFILKIKRKNIEARLADGIDKLLFFLTIVSWIPFLNTYDLPAVIHKNIDLIKLQTNFSEEVHNIQRFTTLCEKLNYIKIPRVHAECTVAFPDLILMEYVKGNTIYAVDPADYEEYASQLMKFVFITTFLNGITHGDLHIGNLLFLKEKLCILDFGITYTFNETRNALFDIFTDLCSIPPETMAKKILNSGLIEPFDVIQALPAEHSAEMVKIIATFVNNTIHVDKRLHQVNIYKFVTDLNNYINSTQIQAFKLKASTELVKIQIVFGMLHGVILTLCGDNYIEVADKVMRETFHLL
jgi:predicted unusual protein kinase regulating ubiquinone biosynthesis (AarF/ABC1/UbiB family)